MASRDHDHTVSSSALTSGQTHTPGPWSHVGGGRVACVGGLTETLKTGREVRRRVAKALGLNASEAYANARLIAAAPDLLAFADYAAGAASGQHADPEATLREIAEQARAIIAKAGAPA